MIDLFSHVSNLLLVITTIIAWITYAKYKDTPLKYLPYYITYAAVLELTSLVFFALKIASAWWYNIGINIEIIFYLLLFYNYLENKITKKILIASALIYESYFLIHYIFYSESFDTYQTEPFVFGGLIVIIFTFLFLLEMFQSDKVLYANKYLIFWISLGILFYNIIPLPSFAVRKIIPDLEMTLVMVIQFTANIIMYLLFIYGFIWSSMKYKS